MRGFPDQRASSCSLYGVDWRKLTCFSLCRVHKNVGNDNGNAERNKKTKVIVGIVYLLYVLRLQFEVQELESPI